MYRQYENPYKLEDELMVAEKELSQALLEGSEGIDYLYERVYSLRERVNFAWQDDEYDQAYANGWTD